MGALKQYNQATPLALFTPSEITSSKSVMVVDPTSSEDRTIFFTDTEITVSEMQAVLVGSATPSVTWTIRYASDRSAAGTEVVTGGTTTTGTTSGSNVTTLDSGTIPADRWVWLETTAQSGTVGELSVTVKFGAPVASGGDSIDYAVISWTAIPTVNASDIDIYLDDTLGNDTTGDGSIGTPYKTIAKGIADMRDGHGDRLWFKRGETWTNQRIGQWSKGGVSSARPIVFGAYGTGARPIIDTQGSDFFNAWNNSPNDVSHVWFDSLNIVSTTYSGGGGGLTAFNINAGLVNGCDDILVQNCRIYNFNWGSLIQSNGIPETDLTSTFRHNDIVFRGCLIEDIWVTASNADASGLLFGSTNNPLIEFCHFHRCGYTAAAQFSDRKHTLYYHNNVVNGVYRYNTETNGADTMFRSGGDIHHNVHSKSAWGYRFGMGTVPGVQTATGAFEDNSVLDAGDSAYVQLVSGLWAGNLNGASIRRNYFLGANTTDARGLWLEQANADGVQLALTNCFVEDNIIYNYGCIGVTMTHFTSLVYWTFNTFKRNQIQSPDNATVWPSGGGADRAINFNSAMTSGNWEMEDNTLNRNGSETGVYCNDDNGGTAYDVPGAVGSNWRTRFADLTSNSTAVNYANADEATLGGYYRSLFTTTGTEDDDHAAMVLLLKANERGAWDDHYTAAAIRNFIESCMEVV